MQINLDPSRRQLRQFGFIALVGFGLLGGLILWKNGLFGFDFGVAARPTAVALFGLGGVSALLSLVAPAANRPLFVGLTLLTFPIGWTISHLALTLLFFGVITPMGWIVRLTGRDLLKRRLDGQAASYWEDVEGTIDRGRYFRQF